MSRVLGVLLLLAAGVRAQTAPTSAPASAPASRVAATRPAVPAGPALAQSTIGMPGWIEDLVIPGSEVEPLPVAGDAPVLVRIARVDPHGDAFRYRLQFQALEAGRYDLATLLRRKDGSPASLPPLLVEVGAVRPAQRNEPNALAPAPLPRLGGYQTLVITAGAVWAVGLLAILLLGRRRRAAALAAARPATLAEQLRPIVQEALAGTVAPDRLAALERMLLSYWRRRLGLEQETAAQAMVTLRAHAEAGALLRALERWLHQPGTQREVDVAALLAPYQALPPEDVPAGPPVRGASA